MRIFKFGGASVKNATAIRNLRHILSNHATEKLFIVVSALGKTTNKLEVIAKHGFNEDPFEDLLKEVIDEHVSIAHDLYGGASQDLLSFFDSLQDSVLDRGTSWEQYYDQVVSHGELLSTQLIHDFLSKTMDIQWLDAREYIITSDHHTRAKVDFKATAARIDRIRLSHDLADLCITQGFIGGTHQNKTTTLGREGSDFSAAIFAQFLQASALVVWKDVPGIMTADPKLSNEVKQYDRLTYRRAVEMTYYGAKVIHPKTMAPLAQAKIPMTVRSFLDLSQPGTLIGSDDDPAEQALPTTVFRYDQVLVSLRMPDKSIIGRVLWAEAIIALEELDIHINLVQQSALSFSFCMDHDHTLLHQLKGMLDGKYAVLENTGLHLVTFMNYEAQGLQVFPEMSEILLEQKTRHHHRVLYRP